MSDIADMYGYDDDEVPRTNNPFTVIDKGPLKEIEIGGQTVQVIDPAYVSNLEKMIRTMDKKIRILEGDLRQIKSRIQSAETGLREARNELDRKVSYE